MMGKRFIRAFWLAKTLPGPKVTILRKAMAFLLCFTLTASLLIPVQKEAQAVPECFDSLAVFQDPCLTFCLSPAPGQQPFAAFLETCIVDNCNEDADDGPDLPDAPCWCCSSSPAPLRNALKTTHVHPSRGLSYLLVDHLTPACIPTFHKIPRHRFASLSDHLCSWTTTVIIV